MAVYQRSEKDIAASKTTVTPPLIRIILGAIAGILLLLAQTGALWAWLGAAAFMLAVCGAGGITAAAAGAIAATEACFRTFGAHDCAGVFWFMLALSPVAGAAAGSLCATISRRLPPQAFAFLAALLPAGIEHLGSFCAYGPLGSTAVTQYAHPFIICVGRLGGLAAVTYVMFLFGAAVAIGVRHIRSTSLLLTAALPPIGLVLLALFYGALSGASTGTVISVSAFNFNNAEADRRQLFSAADYDARAWEAYMAKALERIGLVASRPLVTAAIERSADLEGGSQTPKTAQLVVMPEASVAVDADLGAKFSKAVEVIARNNRCSVAASYYDVASNESRAFVTGSDATASPGYARKRFCPAKDDRMYAANATTRGSASPEAAETAFGKAGVILSLDANIYNNFASIARGGGNIVCVCGWDDAAVPSVSMRLLVCNAALSGLPVVRSARIGTLAVINPDGRIVASETASERKDSLLTASVSLGSGSTLFLHTGNLFAWLSLLAGVAVGLYATTLPPGPDEPGASREPRQTSALSYKTKEGIKDV